jgi:hypothetical protein
MTEAAQDHTNGSPREAMPDARENLTVTSFSDWNSDPVANLSAAISTPGPDEPKAVYTYDATNRLTSKTLYPWGLNLQPSGSWSATPAQVTQYAFEGHWAASGTFCDLEENARIHADPINRIDPDGMADFIEFSMFRQQGGVLHKNWGENVYVQFPLRTGGPGAYNEVLYTWDSRGFYIIASQHVVRGGNYEEAAAFSDAFRSQTKYRDAVYMGSGELASRYAETGLHGVLLVGSMINPISEEALAARIIGKIAAKALPGGIKLTKLAGKWAFTKAGALFKATAQEELAMWKVIRETAVEEAAAVKVVENLALKGFSKAKLAEHFAKHGLEFGNITQSQYLNLAKEFYKAESATIEVAKVGNTLIKYNSANRWVLIVHEGDREIRTFYVAKQDVADPLLEAIKYTMELMQ